MMLTVAFEPSGAPTPTRERHRQFLLHSSRGLLTGEVDGDEPSWLPGTLSELNELLDLPPNWNSYGARAIEPQAVVQAIQLLGAVTSEASPRPNVVPTRRGEGVQLEWHMHDIDVEVEVLPEASAEMFFRNKTTGVEWSASSGPIPHP